MHYCSRAAAFISKKSCFYLFHMEAAGCKRFLQPCRAFGSDHYKCDYDMRQCTVLMKFALRLTTEILHKIVLS